MMNFSIRSFTKISAMLIVSTFAIFLYLFNNLYNLSRELKLIEKNKYEMVMKVAELSQSSDNLTRFARLYTVTKDIEYRDNYYKILSIRRGESPKPKSYNKLYWDLLEPLRSQRHPDGEKSSLQEDMKKLPYTKKQLALIQKSYNKSDELINLELKAFKAMDSNQQKKAIKLLHSKTYDKAKQDVMLPIDEFMFLITKNIKTKITKYKEEIELLFNQIFIVVMFGLIVLSISLFLIRKKVTIPIHTLTRSILSFKTGGKDIPQTVIYDDEIGLMTKQFYLMKQKLDNEYKAIKELSLTDPLTKIKNRRSFFDISEEYLKLAIKRKKPLSLMILDIDFFKKVNDTYGHTIGDDILKLLAKTVPLALRETDVFARYGGEEFVILLPDSSLQNSIQVAQKVRSIIEQKTYKGTKHNLNITVSIGLAELTNEQTVQELITKADELLYKAKENGRNRVEY